MLWRCRAVVCWLPASLSCTFSLEGLNFGMSGFRGCSVTQTESVSGFFPIRRHPFFGGGSISLFPHAYYFQDPAIALVDLWFFFFFILEVVYKKKKKKKEQDENKAAFIVVSLSSSSFFSFMDSSGTQQKMWGSEASYLASAAALSSSGFLLCFLAKRWLRRNLGST